MSTSAIQMEKDKDKTLIHDITNNNIQKSEKTKNETLNTNTFLNIKFFKIALTCKFLIFSNWNYIALNEVDLRYRTQFLQII